MSIEFLKMHGSGNDFVVINASTSETLPDDMAAFTRIVCRKGTGLGADGVILIGESDAADFSWRYINADGSDGEMCGNGAMVGARYAVHRNLAPTICSFETSVGIVEAEVDGERVTLRMVDAEWLGSGLVFDVLPGIDFDHLNLGVPHVVGVVDDADAVSDLDAVGRAIRHDPQLQPRGANVNLIHLVDEHTIRMRTYERGVEAETLACGTGAICSAIAAERRELVTQPVSVIVSSGMTLTVTWQQVGERFTEIGLTGTARIVAEGRILPEIFL
ncbi:MAG: diaminopimelate epimerase [Thermomicrobiales bacterium]|nr:diaminopimelate epimerase [Thermomicrobiales bacterium]